MSLHYSCSALLAKLSRCLFSEKSSLILIIPDFYAGFGESQHPAYQTLTKNDTDIILPDRLNTLSASAQFSCSVELTDITPLSSGPDADELGVLRQDNRLPSLLGDVHQPSGLVRARLEIPTVTESSYSSTIDQLGPEPTFPASQPTRPRLVSPTLTT